MDLVFNKTWVAKPKVSFSLAFLVYQWLKSLCFPYGYALNISRLVNLKDGRLYTKKES